MPSCPRCDTLIDAGWAFCGACGKPRITESLRIPVVQPDWQKRVLQVLIGVVAFWLLITLQLH